VWCSVKKKQALRSNQEIEEKMSRSNGESKEKSPKIRVLAVDGTRMSSQLLADALAQESQFDVAVLEAQSSPIIEIVADRKPNVLLLSAALEGSSTAGFEITRQVHSVSSDTRVILLMDAAKPQSVIEAFRSGAQGIFSRTESSKALAKCIRSVHQGQVWANSAELRYLLQALREAPMMRMVDARGDTILSKREHDVVQCLAEGLSNREIAKKLGLTEHTVKNYLFRIFDKLGVSSRVEVVLYAFNVRGTSNEPAQGRAPLSSRMETSRIENAAVSKLDCDAKRSGEPVRDLARRARA
jgi:two-component system, NarL family, nitrate/nitrite response regulator NarL